MNLTLTRKPTMLNTHKPVHWIPASHLLYNHIASSLDTSLALTLHSHC